MDGRTMYFGPFQDAEKALELASSYFAYEGTPFTLSTTTLLEPLENKFIEFRGF
jgi:hypothetical protein